MNKTNKYRDLCNRIQKLSDYYHDTIVDILIQHQCVINENKKGINKGVSVVMDFIPDTALHELEKRVSFIETIESKNAEIENARLAFNSKNPESNFSIDSTITPVNHAPYSGTPISHTITTNPSLNQKITQLKIKLYQQAHITHRTSSTCFWCTLQIEQPMHICIPTRLREHSGEEGYEETLYEIEGYGSFCRPECAAGYLMHENIDASLKLERYMLLNQIYIPHADGTGGNGIPPAVSPHYIMDKFMGTLTPLEYLKMTEGPSVFTILSKPYTHILPELHNKYIIEQK